MRLVYVKCNILAYKFVCSALFKNPYKNGLLNALLHLSISQKFDLELKKLTEIWAGGRSLTLEICM